MNKEIAKIESTMLGFEDHGNLTAMLMVDYGDGARQGIGGYALKQTAAAFIEGVLFACGVRTWEELTGCTIYVLTEDDGRVYGIQHLPTEPGGLFVFPRANDKTDA